jgi:hypothetical protein
MKEIGKMFILTLPIYLVLFFLFWDDDKLSKEDFLKMEAQKDSIISEVINAKGEKVITHTNREYHPFVIQNSNSSEMVELRQQLKELGIQVKDLKSAIEIQTQASGSGQAQLIRVNDTLDTYEFADTTGKHLKISGKVDVFNGMMDYDYTYSANYKLFSYDYKKNFFKRPELRLKIVSDDPSNTIAAKTFTIKPPREVVSLGFGVGASAVYDNATIKVRPSIHVGLYKSIYTFRTKK